MNKKPQSTVVVFLGILFILAGVFSWWWQSNARRGRYQDALTVPYVMGVIKLNYYQPVSLTKLIRSYWKTGTIAGMLKTLNDPYTRFLSKNEYAELRKDTKGSFGGIGVYLIPKEEELIISSVVSGSPSDKAGLRQGDRIMGVGNELVENIGTEVAIAKIRGASGTKVVLKIARGSGAGLQELIVTLTRRVIAIPTVEMELKRDPVVGEYAHLKIYQFAETTPGDLEKKLAEIQTKPNCRGIILDLRSNPGGSLDAAIKISSMFLPAGTPVLHIQRRGYQLQTVPGERFSYPQLPMVVLVNSWSASASEIVSGALKDQKRAPLVGTHTFGKDLIQEVIELPGNVAITITIASYLTSGKQNIHKKGVQPDKVVEIPGAMEQLLKKGETTLFFKMQTLQEAAAVRMLRTQLQAKLKQAS